MLLKTLNKGIAEQKSLPLVLSVKGRILVQNKTNKIETRISFFCRPFSVFLTLSNVKQTEIHLDQDL